MSSSETTSILVLSTVLFDALKIPSYKLSDEQKNVIDIFIRYNPLKIQKIQDEIEKVLKDGKIDGNDIPALVKIITELYSVQDFLTVDNFYSFIEFVLVVVIDYYVILPPAQKEVLLFVVKNSLDLLKTNITGLATEIQKTGCWSRLCAKSLNRVKQ
jgi:hypothetical protein